MIKTVQKRKSTMMLRNGTSTVLLKKRRRRMFALLLTKILVAKRRRTPLIETGKNQVLRDKTPLIETGPAVPVTRRIVDRERTPPQTLILTEEEAQRITSLTNTRDPVAAAVTDHHNKLSLLLMCTSMF